MSERLTLRQQQYLWLAGSFPDKIVVQGKGYRAEKLMYGIREDELIIFGYSDPLYWLSNRGLVRKLANARAYVLTEAGEDAFRRLLVGGAGLKLNAGVRQVEVRPRRESVLDG